MNNPATPDSLFQQISQLVLRARQQLQCENRAAHGKKRLERVGLLFEGAATSDRMRLVLGGIL